MEGCVFCAIARSEVDNDLVAFRSESVYVIPALRQRLKNRPHWLVLPIGHVHNLHDAAPELLGELVSVVTRLTAAVPRLYRADGSVVLQNNIEPDGKPFHLHLHVIPRFAADGFRDPDPTVAEVPRAQRVAQSADIREHLAH